MTLGTVLTGVGVAGLATGLALALTAGGDDTDLEVAVGPTGFSLRGRF